jgi:hypothetical protein
MIVNVILAQYYLDTGFIGDDGERGDFLILACRVGTINL